MTTELEKEKIRRGVNLAYMAMGALTGLVIAVAISQKIPKVVEQPKMVHSYTMKRIYSDTNKNSLYDTLKTEIYQDGKLYADRTTKMGKECTASEIEKITADRTPHEVIELK